MLELNVDNQVIYDLIKEVRDEQKELVKSMGVHTAKFSEHLISDQKMSDDIKYLKEALHKNNEILDKLTDTVITHENRSTLLEKVVIGTPDQPGLVPRIEKLEEPDKVKEYLRKKYMKWAAVVGATGTVITVITKILGMW